MQYGLLLVYHTVANPTKTIPNNSKSCSVCGTIIKLGDAYWCIMCTSNDLVRTGSPNAPCSHRLVVGWALGCLWLPLNVWCGDDPHIISVCSYSWCWPIPCGFIGENSWYKVWNLVGGWIGRIQKRRQLARGWKPPSISVTDVKAAAMLVGIF